MLSSFRLHYFRILLVLLAGTAWLFSAGGFPSQSASGAAKLSYSKTLKGSVPEYLLITVDANGSGAYEGRKLEEAPNPRSFQLSPATARQLFALAAQLDNFQSIELESGRKVANLGLKTLSYQRGAQVDRVEFNYTENRIAQQLADLFEKISTVEQHIASLEFQIKYDHLSLPRELLQIQIDLESKALADPELMVPTLETIARNHRFLHLAQARAQSILQRIQTSN